MTATKVLTKFRLMNPISKRISGYERIGQSSGAWEFSLDGTNWEAGVFEGGDYSRDQYTGVNDSFGKEIYANDIVARGNHVNQVLFRRGVFGMKPTQRWGYTDGQNKLFALYDMLTIVGNIYSDAHLVKQEVA